ncbi:alkaline phosphatase [Burkholderia pseudomallei]|nr:alkaline phosphatase [Burkholderia mallei]ALB13204.1 alkaline phosphatase [Burkholderia pseudomallei]EMP76921.1 hypothetical protein D512_08433 [Burkholderia pseudomallei MSHR1043]EQA89857.1 alkaline phosphatase [Burkholderia pseudomallei MSHR338]AOP67282.1 alkaline phosphatase [Burkholderia mallei]
MVAGFAYRQCAGARFDVGLPLRRRLFARVNVRAPRR